MRFRKVEGQDREILFREMLRFGGKMIVLRRGLKLWQFERDRIALEKLLVKDARLVQKSKLIEASGACKRKKQIQGRRCKASKKHVGVRSEEDAGRR